MVVYINEIKEKWDRMKWNYGDIKQDKYEGGDMNALKMIWISEWMIEMTGMIGIMGI